MLKIADIEIRWADQQDGSHWRATVSGTVDGWRLRVVLNEKRGGIVVRDFHLTPASRKQQVPDAGVTARLLKTISLSGIREAASATAKENFNDSERAAAEMHALLTGAPPQFGGRRGMSDLEMAALGIRFEELAKDNKVKAVKRLATERHIEPASARNLLSRLRGGGWLDGNQASTKARNLMADQEGTAERTT